jgi:hypothetical protein
MQDYPSEKFLSESLNQNMTHWVQLHSLPAEWIDQHSFSSWWYVTGFDRHFEAFYFSNNSWPGVLRINGENGSSGFWDSSNGLYWKYNKNWHFSKLKVLICIVFEQKRTKFQKRRTEVFWKCTNSHEFQLSTSVSSSLWSCQWGGTIECSILS